MEQDKAYRKSFPAPDRDGFGQLLIALSRGMDGAFASCHPFGSAAAMSD